MSPSYQKVLPFILQRIFIFVQINIGIDIHIDNVTDVDVEALQFRFETEEGTNCTIYFCKFF